MHRGRGARCDARLAHLVRVRVSVRVRVRVRVGVGVGVTVSFLTASARYVRHSSLAYLP